METSAGSTSLSWGAVWGVVTLGRGKRGEAGMTGLAVAGVGIWELA